MDEDEKNKIMAEIQNELIRCLRGYNVDNLLKIKGVHFFLRNFLQEVYEQSYPSATYTCDMYLKECICNLPIEKEMFKKTCSEIGWNFKQLLMCQRDQEK